MRNDLPSRPRRGPQQSPKRTASRGPCRETAKPLTAGVTCQDGRSLCGESVSSSFWDEDAFRRRRADDHVGDRVPLQRDGGAPPSPELGPSFENGEASPALECINRTLVAEGRVRGAVGAADDRPTA